MAYRLPLRRLPLLSFIFALSVGYCFIVFTNQALNFKRYPDTVSDYSSIDQEKSLIHESKSEYRDAVNIRDREDKNSLYNKVRLLCWVLTSPGNHETKARAVKETWGPHCNILLFMSTTSDPTLPTVQLPTYEGRNQLWGKTREAFRHIWQHYRDQADWFLKADDDTFVIVENLRYFLSPFNTSKPMWFGHKFKPHTKKGYFSGGAGYVLSKEAVKLFVGEGYFNGLICKYDHTGAEDAEMGKCLEKLNVTAMDSRDSKGRGRFFPFVPESHIRSSEPTTSYWYWNYIYYPSTKGRDCCSDSAVSFHYVNPEKMRVLYYLIYKLRPFGKEIEQRPSTPEPPPDLDLTATPWSVPNKTTTSTPATTQILSTTTQKLINSTQPLSLKEGSNSTFLNTTQSSSNNNNSTTSNVTQERAEKSSSVSRNELVQLDTSIANLRIIPGLSNETSKMLMDYIFENSKLNEVDKNLTNTASGNGMINSNKNSGNAAT